MKLKKSLPNLFMFAALALFAAGLLAPTAFAEPTPGYNNKIPESIMTPDTVESRIGTLKFFDGIPTKETAALVYDHLDFIRGVETFLKRSPCSITRSDSAWLYCLWRQECVAGRNLREIDGQRIAVSHW